MEELVQPGGSTWGLLWSLFAQYSERFYRIPPFLILLLFYLLCICWDWQGQNCNLKYPKVYEINTELNSIYCNFCHFPIFVVQTPLPTASQKYTCCSWNSIISEWSFSWNQIIFYFIGIKEISTLKSYIKLFLIKLSADISDSNFLLDYLSKAKIFRNVSTDKSFLFFNKIWNVIFLTDVILL